MIFSGASYAINDIEAAWNTNTQYEEGNKGHRPMVKGGYFPLSLRLIPHKIFARPCVISWKRWA